MPHPLHLFALDSSSVNFAGIPSPRRLLGLMAGAVSAAAIGLSVLTVSPASAATVVFSTPAGSTVTDGAVNASATFITDPGSITVVLADLLANPRSVGQLLSDISFTFTGALASGATLGLNVGQEITVADNGTATLGGFVATGWGLSATGTSTLHLDALGQPISPAHLIIGPPGAGGTYDNANSSIAGNDPHNPFLNQTAGFVIDLLDPTALATITAVTFSFGTTEGAELVAGVPGGTPTPFENPPGSTPIPSAVWLFAGGLGLLGMMGRRRKHQSHLAWSKY
jgi:hypothetical protein